MSNFFKWQNISAPAKLAEGDIHIYALNLVSNDDSLFKLLNPDEQAQALRFVFAKDKTRYIQTRGRLRLLCGHCLDKDPAQIEFSYNANGKPYIINSALKFNVSHSHEKALYIFTWNREVGIDVEYMGRHHDLPAIAQRFFSSEEQALLAQVDPSNYVKAFYTIWTRKEAYIKAKGVGLSQALDSFAVNISEPAKFLRLPPGENWFLENVALDGPYCGACVVK